MARPRTFRPDDIPIPTDVQAHENWAPIMLDMAAHIGPYSTLLLVDAFAGQNVYVSRNPDKNPFIEIVGADKAAIITQVYCRERLQIPSGRRELLRARRQGIVAAVRERLMTASEGAAILRMPRRHFTRLLNKTDEGLECQPLVLKPRKDPRQLDMFSETDPA
ncbi:hypothetical protein [Novosphingobium sp. KACC 22771]|uniref:hypothetical protein n=1 Tax=Novosphingobium sp. KACC 22771 TaxID=3025670 RepID=UPI0023657C14|nr:hypothetical protein [Novosphingobium sp. KACC 22771]WDF73506.1 hypothetical protein PQ467_05525 [Novosphingobium sp. KACC 22771]